MIISRITKPLCLTVCLVLAGTMTGQAANPIIPNRGVTDPHIHIFNGKAYLFATHDRSAASKKFAMDDWWCWSSDDLMNWKLESVLKPEQTCLGKPYDECWATDAAFCNGKYYWYFSEHNQQTGVVVADSPAGPWADPLKKPLLPNSLTPTAEYDPTVFRDDDGQYYIVFGVRNYHIARLNADMISLAEKPRPLVRLKEDGTPMLADDKNFLHKYRGNYYLSWGCSYAISTNLYGPYQFKRTLFRVGNFEPGCEKPTWPSGVQQGRHGSFFEWNHQWYFAYCDMSRTGSRFFRDAFISYVHYRANGEIADVKVEGIGVGEYDAKRGPIEAENYFAASPGTEQRETAEGGFVVGAISDGDYLVYPNIHGLAGKTKIQFNVAGNKGCAIEIRDRSPEGILLQTGALPSNGATAYTFELPPLPDTTGLCFVFRGKPSDLVQFDSFLIQ
jgi:GH43 family beta-xylosidase